MGRTRAAGGARGRPPPALYGLTTSRAGPGAHWAFTHWRPGNYTGAAASRTGTGPFLKRDRSCKPATEAGTKRRASLHLVADEAGLAAHERGGVDVFTASAGEFAAALTRGNHTLKRALTDPRLFSGIGNAYSDEILHAARLSPVTLTSRLTPAEGQRLQAAAQRVLREWTARLRAEVAGGFPGNVTAFRPEMAVHGKFGQPCPVCGTKVQRIRYAENEVNYCPRCQTGGKVLADRSLSRLLNSDWPKTVEEMEAREAAREAAPPVRGPRG